MHNPQRYHWLHHWHRILGCHFVHFLEDWIWLGCRANRRLSGLRNDAVHAKSLSHGLWWWLFRAKGECYLSICGEWCGKWIFTLCCGVLFPLLSLISHLSVPAMFMLKLLSTPKAELGALIGLGFVCAFFGTFLAIPLRKFYIIRQRCIFPSACATAIPSRQFIRLARLPKSKFAVYLSHLELPLSGVS